MPNERVNQPSQRVSPEAKNGRASVRRSTSSASEAGTKPNAAWVKRATTPEIGFATDAAASAVMSVLRERST